MADVCSALTFAGIHGDAFCFVGEFTEDEVDTDTFELSKTWKRLIRCHNDSFLIFNEAEAKFDQKELTEAHTSSDGYKLNLNIYKDVSSNAHIGKAVILYALQGDKKYAAVCKNDTEVCPEEIQLDGPIEGSEHEAVFFMIHDKSTNTYKFKSSRYQQKVLGFGGPSDSELKLMLCPDDGDSEQENFSF